MENSRKIWYDQNDQPPKNYIWYKNGQYLEWNGERWVASTGMNSKESINSDMTEAEQMQARKNLGLYYEETTKEEKTVDSGYETLENTKVSNDSPAKEDIIRVIADTGLTVSFTFTDIENGYRINVLDKYPFYILTEGENKGIFVGGPNISDWTLVYNGPITTIEKIDEKYLPEQEDVGPVIVSDITNLSLNPSVLAKAKAGDVFVEKNATTGTETVYILSFIPHTEGSFGDDVYNISFVNIDNTNITVVRYTTTGFQDMWNYSGKSVFKLGAIPAPIEITGLPTAEMTTQVELDAIGLTNIVIKNASKGLHTGVIYRNTSIFSWTFCPITLASMTDLGMDYTFEFTFETSKYKIVCISGTITVTVTSV